jgi:hypothetical protein
MRAAHQLPIFVSLSAVPIAAQVLHLQHIPHLLLSCSRENIKISASRMCIAGRDRSRGSEGREDRGSRDCKEIRVHKESRGRRDSV